MKRHRTSLEDVILTEVEGSADSRGYLFEAFQAGRHGAAGIVETFVQDNVSYSERGVLRGLHLQYPRPQGKLVYVLQGAVFDVAVDVRVGSPGFGCWTGAELTARNRRQLYIPPGFAHGFCVTGDSALCVYKCSDFYDSSAEITIAWNDPAIGIDWPVGSPLLSDKDLAAPPLEQLDPDHLPKFNPCAANRWTGRC